MRAVPRARRAQQALIGGACVLAFAGTAFSGPASAAPGDPAGANGTVKIDGLAFDAHPNNQPHVGCSFQVDFYGFDQGAHTANVTFAVQPPTGGFTTIATDQVFIGEDAAGGATDVDAERTYDLASELAAYDAHPNQGHHVKLTVEAPGANGKIATKHKVFWTEGCEAPVCYPTGYGDEYCPDPSNVS
jgi:hypothetical protein